MNNSNIHRRFIIKNYYRCLLICAIIGSSLFMFADRSLLHSLSNGIKVHFELPFLYGGNITTVTIAIFKHSWQDIICLLFVFMFAFSVFFHKFTYLILIYKGIVFGVSFTSVFFCFKITSGFPDISSIIIYIMSEIACVIVLLWFSYYTICFSVELNKIKSDYGICKTYKKLALSYFLHFLFAVGFMLGLCFVYCIFLHIM